MVIRLMFPVLLFYWFAANAFSVSVAWSPLNYSDWNTGVFLVDERPDCWGLSTSRNLTGCAYMSGYSTPEKEVRWCRIEIWKEAWPRQGNIQLLFHELEHCRRWLSKEYSGNSTVEEAAADAFGWRMHEQLVKE